MSFHISHRTTGNVGLVYPLEMGRTGADDEICLLCISRFLGGAIFLLSFVADRQAKLGDDRVARKMSHSVIDSRFVRNER